MSKNNGDFSATILALLFLASSTIAYAGSSADILKANRTAAGKWPHSGTLSLDFSYSGQGLTGAMHTTYDLSGGGFADSYTIGPTSGASGFDGTHAWVQEASGVVSDQQSGDVLPLAFNEAYRDGNLWWRGDRAGAGIADAGINSGTSFDVLVVTPKSGKSFEAWFDRGTHFLARTVEAQGSQTVTTYFSNYAPIDGMRIAHKIVVDDGSGNLQTQILNDARVRATAPKSRYAAPTVAQHDYAIAGGATETTIPFQLLNNHIYLDVSVNHAKPELFIFDTGGRAVISSSLASVLSQKVEGSQTVVGGGSGFSQTGAVRIASLCAGGATLTDQPASVAGFFAAAPIIEGVNAQGMIGYEFLARFVTRIDYGVRTITFIDAAHFDASNAGSRVPLTFYNELPVAAGSYDGIPGEFHIDTGARMALMLTGPFVAAHDLRARAANGVQAMTGFGVGGPSFSFVTRGDRLTIGDVAIDAPLTMFNLDKGGSGAAEWFPNNVGGGILKRFVVTFDYPHYAMYLKPIPGPIADLDAFDRSGMWINGDKDGLKIAYISAGTPAESAGLRAGDVVVRVDGVAAGQLHLSDIRQRLRNDSPGTVIKLSIMRDGKPKDAAIVLRDLI